MKLGKRMRRKIRLKYIYGGAEHLKIADAGFPKLEALPHLLIRPNKRQNRPYKGQIHPSLEPIIIK
jgi:hypothetical protein